MRWKEQLPWVTRPLGQLPATTRERLLCLLYALRDLPRTLRQDSTVEMAAGMTFFLLFSIFPGLLFLVALLPYLPMDAPVTRLLEVARPILPGEVYRLLSGHIEGLISRPRTGLLTVSAAVALYSASRALLSLSRSLNRSYRVPRLGSEILRRLRSILLTVTALLGVVLAVLSLSLGDHLVALVVERGWLPISSGVLIATVRWPVLLLLGAFFVQQLYFLLPDQRPRWRPISSGSLFALLGWLAATWMFTTFVTLFVRFNATYGSLGSLAVVMAWMFLGSFALMAGGTVNALVDRGLPPRTERGDQPAPAPLGEIDAMDATALSPVSPVDAPDASPV